MRSKLFAGVMTGAMLATLASVPPAQARKAPTGIVKTDNHGGKTAPLSKTDPCITGKSTKKSCQPWAIIPMFPTGGTFQKVTQVGGHFHFQYIDANLVPQDQEVNLVNSHGKAATQLTYREAGCGDGEAVGQLAVKLRRPTSATVKGHNEPFKEDAHYAFTYRRIGASAAFIATNKKKNETITGKLVFHAKTTPADLAERCAAGTGGPLKVFFDLIGTVVNLDA